MNGSARQWPRRVKDLIEREAMIPKDFTGHVELHAYKGTITKVVVVETFREKGE